MIFRREFMEGIIDGRITLAYRRWDKARVKAGGTQGGEVVLAFDAVDIVETQQITESDALRAGFPNKAALMDEVNMRGTDGHIFRVTVRYVGADPRVLLREENEFDDAARAEVVKQLAAIDKRSVDGPWTMKLLRLVRKHEGERAADMGARVGLEKDEVIKRMKKLNNLGLSEWLAKGYRLSPRGHAFLEKTENQKPKTKSTPAKPAAKSKAKSKPNAKAK